MDIKEILKKHKMWLNNEIGGKRANLRDADLWGADLCGVNLRDADLRGANLRGADLSGANLWDADLSGADLCCADLRGANLRGANLRGANLWDASLRDADLRGASLRDADLCGADLRGVNLRDADLWGADLCCADLWGADLCCADLRGADLRDADLRGASLRGANLRGAKNLDNVTWSIYTAFYPLQCPEEGEYIAWKKAHGKIVKLKITESAKRSSAVSRKCRASEALVLDIQSIDGMEHLESVASDRDSNFIYRVGEIVRVNDFDEDRWNECSTGIHHFITREEAVKYN